MPTSEDRSDYYISSVLLENALSSRTPCLVGHWLVVRGKVAQGDDECLVVNTRAESLSRRHILLGFDKGITIHMRRGTVGRLRE